MDPTAAPTCPYPPLHFRRSGYISVGSSSVNIFVNGQGGLYSLVCTTHCRKRILIMNSSGRSSTSCLSNRKYVCHLDMDAEGKQKAIESPGGYLKQLSLKGKGIEILPLSATVKNTVHWRYFGKLSQEYKKRRGYTFNNQKYRSQPSRKVSNAIFLVLNYLSTSRSSCESIQFIIVEDMSLPRKQNTIREIRICTGRHWSFLCRTKASSP